MQRDVPTQKFCGSYIYLALVVNSETVDVEE